jgi:cell division protein FtsQ
MDEHRTPNYSSRRRPRRTKIRSGVGMNIYITLVAVLVLILGVSVFFKVNRVEVRGNSLYDSETVLMASGLELGDTLLTVNKGKAAAKIEVALPYVEHVRVSRVLPDTIVIEITESEAVFSVRSDAGEYWLMNYRGKLLESVDETTAGEHAAIVGFTVIAPEIGETATPSNKDSFDAAMTVLSQMSGTGLMATFTRLDTTKTYDIVMLQGEQYEICLGSTEEMDYKFRFLKAVLEELSDNQPGTIDLTFRDEKVAKFMPW